MWKFIESLKKDNRWPLVGLVFLLLFSGPESLDSWVSLVKPLVCEECKEENPELDEWKKTFDEYKKQTEQGNFSGIEQ